MSSISATMTLCLSETHFPHVYKTWWDKWVDDFQWQSAQFYNCSGFLNFIIICKVPVESYKHCKQTRHKCFWTCLSRQSHNAQKKERPWGGSKKKKHMWDGWWGRTKMFKKGETERDWMSATLWRACLDFSTPKHALSDSGPVALTPISAYTLTLPSAAATAMHWWERIIKSKKK